jgi:hypothetical protein
MSLASLNHKSFTHSTASHSTKKKCKKGPRAGCWVCKERDHYASVRHTDEEIAAAKAQGKSVIAYATELSTSFPKSAVRVLNAHVAFLEASSSSENNSTDTDDDDDVADVSNANVTRAPVADAHVDAFHLNAATAAAAYNAAFVFTISSRGSSVEDMEYELKTMSRKLSSDDQPFGGIVLDSACTGASVVSATEYKRYCRDTGAEYSIDPNSCGYVRFGDADVNGTKGRLKSLGTATIHGYVPESDEFFEFFCHVIPGTNTPMLISLQDM